MKKLKIMLLSFALLAIVGGALSFKATFDEPYCTTSTEENPQHEDDLCKIDGIHNNPVKDCDVVSPLEPGTNPELYCYTLDDFDGKFDCFVNEAAPIQCEITPTELTDNG